MAVLHGYAEANEFIEAERMARLSRMTPAESRRIFEELYQVWERAGRQSGGDWEALAACRSKPGEASLNPGVEALAGEIARFRLKPPLQNLSPTGSWSVWKSSG